MTIHTEASSRTEHLLALMTIGDDLFNARDWQALEDVHHPDMIAFIPESADPIYGREAHGAAMQQLVRMFPDVRVHTPYPIQFGGDDWITVVTSATGTFTGEMALPDGKVVFAVTVVGLFRLLSPSVHSVFLLCPPNPSP